MDLLEKFDLFKKDKVTFPRSKSWNRVVQVIEDKIDRATFYVDRIEDDVVYMSNSDGDEKIEVSLNDMKIISHLLNGKKRKMTYNMDKRTINDLNNLK